MGVWGLDAAGGWDVTSPALLPLPHYERQPVLDPAREPPAVGDRLHREAPGGQVDVAVAVEVARGQADKAPRLRPGQGVGPPGAVDRAAVAEADADEAGVTGEGRRGTMCGSQLPRSYWSLSRWPIYYSSNYAQ